MLLILVGFLFTIFVLLASWALLGYFVHKTHEVSARLIDKLDEQDSRAYDAGRVGLEGELRATRDSLERERILMQDSLERERDLFDRYLEKKGVVPLGNSLKEPPPPLTLNWNEQDMVLYRSWSNEERFVAVAEGRPDPREDQLEKDWRMKFGSARPSEVF